jgi:hypothetical protein
MGVVSGMKTVKFGIAALAALVLMAMGRAR